MTAAPGTYEVIRGQVEILPDGTYVLREMQLKPTGRKERPGQGCKMGDIWNAAAPFSFQHLWNELRRIEFINDAGVWIYYPLRGNHPTCSVHVRALYETLLMLNCIDDLSFREVMEVFNNTFSTRIHCSRVLENKNKCTEEARYFEKMFEAFANANANAVMNINDD